MIDLHEGEQIVLVKRRYWLPIAAESFTFLLIALMPWGILYGLNLLPSDIEGFVRNNMSAFYFLACAWLLVVWTSFFVAWTNYHLDVFIVTSERIIDIDQVGLFARDVAEARLENIQDVRIETIGVLASIINFGNIHIQSAGATKEFTAQHIHKPQEIRGAITKLRRAEQPPRTPSL